MKHGEPAWPDEFMAEVARRKTGLKKYLVDADIYYGNGAYEKSISLLDPTVEKYPDSAWAKILLARALIRTGAPDSSATDRESRLDRAVHLLEAALKLEPQSVEAMFRLGVAKGYQGKIQEAAELYGRAAEAKPDFTMAHFNLANAHYQMGDRDAAIASLETVVAIQPDMVDARLQLGILLLQSGKYADAEKHLDFAARQQPENARIRKFLGQARQKMRP
jgi:tetratricopeptide (TPR) repeat protein